jgi:ferredoxin
MKVSVESERCQGHTLCAMIAPESFELDDVDGHAHAVAADVRAEHHDQVQEAARSCPEQAITVLIEACSDHSRSNGAVL